MPELPEVETIKRQMNRALKGIVIRDIKVIFAKKNYPSKNKFIKILKGKRILSVERRAKVIIVKLSGGYTIVIHLKMTGKLLLKKKGDTPTKHVHVIFNLSNNKELHWEDFRKFGWIKVLKNEEFDKWLALQNFGPEPLKTGFDWKHFAECLRKKPNATIKPTLLSPQCVAGIGNIYATEALWLAKINPEIKISKLTDADFKKLHSTCIKVLKQAIPARGTSSDSYVDLYGKSGTFVPQLKVYGRDGQACKRCRTILIKKKIGGRGTTYCPTCQKNK